MSENKKRRPGGQTPGRQRNKTKRGTSPQRKYNTGGAGVQVKDALYELEKQKGPLLIHHDDETERRKEIAERVGV